MAERYTFRKQTEHLHLKYVGSGHADITKFEWLENHHRDTYASYVGHPDLLRFLAVATNKSTGRLRHEFLTKMIQPCGENPHKDEDEP